MIFAVALIAVALAAQPLESPKEKRVPKGESAQSASKPESTSKPQEPPQTSNSATAPTSTATSQPAPKPSESNTDSEVENVQIQRRIEVFTGTLAVVAVLQLGVGFLTWLVYRRQAEIMESQRQTMQGQLAAMQSQLTQMEAAGKQTDSIIAAARDSAEAALRSVKLQEAQLKQWIEVKDWEVEETIDRNRLWIRCKVVNPTTMPITIRTVKWWTTYGELTPYDANWPVSPRDIYPPQFPMMLWGTLQDDFENKKLNFSIVLTIDFEDSSGKMLYKRFSYTIECGRDRPCIVSPAWGGTHVEDKKDNPN